MGACKPANGLIDFPLARRRHSAPPFHADARKPHKGTTTLMAQEPTETQAPPEAPKIKMAASPLPPEEIYVDGVAGLFARPEVVKLDCYRRRPDRRRPRRGADHHPSLGFADSVLSRSRDIGPERHLGAPGRRAGGGSRGIGRRRGRRKEEKAYPSGSGRINGWWPRCYARSGATRLRPRQSALSRPTTRSPTDNCVAPSYCVTGCRGISLKKN